MGWIERREAGVHRGRQAHGTWWIAAAMVIAALAAGVAHAADAPGVAWQPLSIDQALARAKLQGKIVMVDVWAEHCGDCMQMEREVWTSEAAAALTAGLVPLHISSVTPEGDAFMRRYPVTGLPAIIFLRADGTEIDRVVGYPGAEAFLGAAAPMARGIDPVPAMEAQLKASPDSLGLMFDLMKRYLDRARDADARNLLARILELDRDNGKTIAERAIVQLAKYEDNFRRDYQAAWDDWKNLAETYPRCSSIGGALDGAYRAAVALGTISAWQAWACDLAARNREAGNLQYAAVMTAYRNGLRDPCFAPAARAAAAAGVKNVKLPTIAQEMEAGPAGAPPAPRWPQPARPSHPSQPGAR
jgi:hypothetical protein